MKVLPVLDLLNGLVVRGVAGRRDEYRPVESCLATGAEPLPIARAFRTLGLESLYIADLDAILEQRPNIEACRALAEDGFETLVDPGLRDVDSAERVFQAGARGVVAGLETSPGPDHVRALLDRHGPERVVFSLDLQEGRAIGELMPWKTRDPFGIASQAVEAGVRRMIALDLAGVGVAAGVSTLALCRRLRAEFPEIELITGGGIRSVDDLCLLQSLGIDGALVASALHNGTIGIDELRRLEHSNPQGFKLNRQKD